MIVNSLISFGAFTANSESVAYKVENAASAENKPEMSNTAMDDQISCMYCVCRYCCVLHFVGADIKAINTHLV